VRSIVSSLSACLFLLSALSLLFRFRLRSLRQTASAVLMALHALPMKISYPPSLSVVRFPFPVVIASELVILICGSCDAVLSALLGPFPRVSGH